MRTYGAPESNRYEAVVVLALYGGASLLAAGWAYATDALQIVLVAIGAVVMASSVYFMIRSRQV